MRLEWTIEAGNRDHDVIARGVEAKIHVEATGHPVGGLKHNLEWEDASVDDYLVPSRAVGHCTRNKRSVR